MQMVISRNGPVLPESIGYLMRALAPSGCPLQLIFMVWKQSLVEGEQVVPPELLCTGIWNTEQYHDTSLLIPTQ